VTRHKKGEYRLAERFWTRFEEQHWEKRPLVLKRPFAAPMGTATEVFAAIVAARETLARNEKRHLRCFVGKEVHRSGLRRNLPRSSDRDFLGYRKRIRQSLGGKRFGLVIVDYPEFDPDIRRRIKQFLRSLKTVLGTRIGSKRCCSLAIMNGRQSGSTRIHMQPLSLSSKAGKDFGPGQAISFPIR
jgi:hypothetical protein